MKTMRDILHKHAGNVQFEEIDDPFYEGTVWIVPDTDYDLMDGDIKNAANCVTLLNRYEQFITKYEDHTVAFVYVTPSQELSDEEVEEAENLACTINELYNHIEDHLISYWDLAGYKRSLIRRAIANWADTNFYDAEPMFGGYFWTSPERIEKLLLFHLPEHEYHLYFSFNSPVEATPDTEALYSFIYRYVKHQIENLFKEN